jgi:hypothetical protein
VIVGHDARGDALGLRRKTNEGQGGDQDLGGAHERDPFVFNRLHPTFTPLSVNPRVAGACLQQVQPASRGQIVVAL